MQLTPLPTSTQAAIYVIIETMYKYIIPLILSLVLSSCTMRDTGPRKVEIVGEKGSWQLLLDGKPFFIQGVGVGYAWGKDGENYLKLARDMGANAVRTWGVNQGTVDYLNTAYEYGLKVDAGIWLNHPYGESSISYIGNTRYKQKAREKTLQYVKKFKDHPAVLMWNVGNEVLFFSRSDKERIAFCRFLEELVQEIKKIDPGKMKKMASLRDKPHLC